MCRKPADGVDDVLDPVTATFVVHRPLLFTVAYQMLGSASDAEDVVQESWLRWAGVDLDVVRDRRAYLVRIATRQALSRLRTLRRRREAYVGPWLPEPVITAPDVAEDIELAESVSMAMLLVLETLTPPERAVFVLREVFGFGYDEIAEALDKRPSAVYQIAHRARAHVASRRPRFSVSPDDARHVVEAFLRAVRTGDLARLLELLAPDVVFLGDGGGIAEARLTPAVGPDVVAPLFAGSRLAGRSAGSRLGAVDVNGSPGLVLWVDGAVDTVVVLGIDGGLVSRIYAVRNPDKLTHMERVATVVRRA